MGRGRESGPESSLLHLRAVCAATVRGPARRPVLDAAISITFTAHVHDHDAAADADVIVSP